MAMQAQHPFYMPSSTAAPASLPYYGYELAWATGPGLRNPCDPNRHTDGLDRPPNRWFSQRSIPLLVLWLP